MGNIELIMRSNGEVFKINCNNCGTTCEQKMIEIKEGHIVCSNCKKKL